MKEILIPNLYILASVAHNQLSSGTPISVTHKWVCNYPVHCQFKIDSFCDVSRRVGSGGESIDERRLAMMSR